MLDQGVVASGYMKQLTYITTPMYLLNLPLTYLTLKIGGTPPTAYMVGALPIFLAFLSNLYILKRYTNFPAYKFFISVFLKNLLLILIASIIPIYIEQRMAYGFERFIIVCITSVICTILILYWFALDKDSRIIINNKIKHLLKK